MQLNGNPLPIDVGHVGRADDSRNKLPEIFAATTVLDMIRDPAFVITNALQDLELPALVTLEILDPTRSRCTKSGISLSQSNIFIEC